MYRWFVFLLALVAVAAQGKPKSNEIDGFVEGANTLCEKADVPDYLKATTFLYRETLKAGIDPNPVVIQQRAKALKQMIEIAQFKARPKIIPRTRVTDSQAFKNLEAAADSLTANRFKGLSREAKLNALKQAFKQVEKAAKFARPLEKLLPPKMRPRGKTLRFGSMNPFQK